MKTIKLIYVFILLLTFTYAKGQDKIITTQNDTVFCRIIYVSASRIAYIQNEQTGENGKPEGKFIQREQVKEYYQGSPLTGTSRSTQSEKQNVSDIKRLAVIAKSEPTDLKSVTIGNSAPADLKPVIIGNSAPADLKPVIIADRTQGL